MTVCFNHEFVRLHINNPFFFIYYTILNITAVCHIKHERFVKFYKNNFNFPKNIANNEIIKKGAAILPPLFVFARYN